MSLCPKCSRSRWPFIVIFGITSMISATTWLVLGLSAMDPLTRALIALGVFVGVGGTLLHYVISCLKRHCRHGHEAGSVGSPGGAGASPRGGFASSGRRQSAQAARVT